MNIKKYLIFSYLELTKEEEGFGAMAGLLHILLFIFIVYPLSIIFASITHQYFNYEFYIPYNHIKYVIATLCVICLLTLLVIHGRCHGSHCYKTENDIPFVRAEYLLIPVYLSLFLSTKIMIYSKIIFSKLLKSMNNIFFSDISKKKEKTPEIQDTTKKSIVLNAIKDKKNNLMSSK